MQETQLWSLGQENPLEEGMATHSSIFAREIPWTDESGGLQSVGSRVRLDWSDLAQQHRMKEGNNTDKDGNEIPLMK